MAIEYGYYRYNAETDLLDPDPESLAEAEDLVNCLTSVLRK